MNLLIPLMVGTWLTFSASGQAVEKQKLNIIFILADDLGWKDLGSYGSSLYESQRGKASELTAKLDLWRRQVGAQMPLPNPNYDPIRAKEH